MDIVRNATGHDPAGSPDASVEAELASLVDVYGLAILQVPEQIKLRLAQACPGAQRQIDAVLSALAADVPQRLRKAHDDEKLHGLLQQLVERVEDHGSLDAATASWAVRAWAHALALPTDSLARPASPQEPSMAREFASVVTPLSKKPPPAVDEARSIGSHDTKIDSDETIVGRAMVAPAAVEPEVVEPEAVEPEAVVPPIAPAWTAYSTAAENAAATGLAAGAVEPDIVLPAQPPREPRAPTGRRPLAIGAALVVIVLAIFFGADGARWLSSATTSVQTRTQPSTQPPTQTTTPRDTSTADATPPQPAPASPAPEKSGSSAPTTTDAATTASAPAQSTAGDNQAVPAEPASPAPAAPASTPSSPTTNRREASEPAAVASKLDAPSASASTDAEPRAPASSAPSTASSSSAEAQHPTITRIDVPRVVVGAPFSVALRIDTGARDVAMVEHKVIDGSAVRLRATSVTPRTGLRRSRNGALLIPFKAIDAPGYATLEFTAIDRNGLRSAPKRATFTVAAAPAVATSNCTRTTCGTVVAVREVDVGSAGRSSDRGARLYEVIVRMDDRTIHKAVVPEYWSAGTWVQMVGGRFVSMRSGSR